MYDAQRIHDSQLILRQLLKDDSERLDRLSSSPPNRDSASSAENYRELRFGRVIALEESCKKQGSRLLSPSKIKVQAWLFDDRLDPQVLTEPVSIGEQLTRFQAFFFAGERYEALHPYLQSLGISEVLLLSREVQFHSQKVVVTLEMQAHNTASEKLLAQEPILVGSSLLGSYSKAQELAQADPNLASLPREYADAAKSVLKEG